MSYRNVPNVQTVRFRYRGVQVEVIRHRHLPLFMYTMNDVAKLNLGAHDLATTLKKVQARVRRDRPYRSMVRTTIERQFGLEDE